MNDPTASTVMEEELAKALHNLETEFEAEKQELKLQIDYQMNGTLDKMKARFRQMMCDIAARVKLSDVSVMDKQQLVIQESMPVEVPIIPASSSAVQVNDFVLNGQNSNGLNSKNLNGTNTIRTSMNSFSLNVSSTKLNSSTTNSTKQNSTSLNSHEALYQQSTSNGFATNENNENLCITETISPLDFEDSQNLMNGDDYESDSSSVIFEDEIPIDRNASMLASIAKTSDQLLEELPTKSSKMEELKKLDLVIVNGPSPNTKQLMLNGTNVRMQVVSAVEVVSPPTSKSSSLKHASPRTSAKSFEASPIHRSGRIERKRLIETTFSDDSMNFNGDYVDNSNGNGNAPRNVRHQRSLPARWKDISTQCYSRTVYMSCPYPGCIAKLSKRGDYDMHLLGHNVKPYRCTIAGCGASFVKHAELGAHFRSAHVHLTEWPCNLCKKAYKGYPRLITHLRYEHEFGLFQCVFPGCEFTAKNRKCICDHYVQLHREVNRQYVCDYPNCARQCVSNTQLIYHQYHHLTYKPYKCLWECCHQECTRSDAIYRHIEIQHLKLPHPGTMNERKELDKWIEVRHNQMLREPIRFVDLPGLYENAL